MSSIWSRFVNDHGFKVADADDLVTIITASMGESDITEGGLFDFSVTEIQDAITENGGDHSQGNVQDRIELFAAYLASRCGLFDPPSHELVKSSTLADKRSAVLRLQKELHRANSLDDCCDLLAGLVAGYASLIAPFMPRISADSASLGQKFPIHFFDFANDPFDIIDTFFGWFFDPKLEELYVLPYPVKVIIKNAYAATDLAKKKDNIVLPSEWRSQKSPQEVMELYFGGTPFVDIFDFTVMISLSTEDRFKHQYVLGKTGSGKSVLLRSQIANDINAGHGVVVITPESGLIQDALSYVPPEREKDVVYFDPSTSKTPLVGFNPFDVPDTGDQLTQKAGELEVILLRSLGELGIKMRPIFSNTVYALLETKGTFADIPRLLDPHDPTFRHGILNQLDERTREFFVKYDDSRYYKEAYEPIINRLDALLRPPLAQTLGTATLDFPKILNHNASIVLCSLSGLRGFQAEVVGQLLLATFQQTFFQRDYIKEADRIPYFFYMDEFQTYATSNESSLKDFLTRARKYKTGIVMAHQNTKDIPGGLLSSIFGNCGTLMGMLMSAEDAKRFATESQLTGRDGSDSKAYRQLQNFLPGQVAMATPSKKKAFVIRVPERPPGLTTRSDYGHLIAQSKEAHGITPRQVVTIDESLTTDDDDLLGDELDLHSDHTPEPIPSEATQKKTPPKKKTTPKKRPPDDTDDDDFAFIIS